MTSQNIDENAETQAFKGECTDKNKDRASNDWDSIYKHKGEDIQLVFQNKSND